MFRNQMLPMGFEPGLPGQVFFCKISTIKFRKQFPAFFAPIFANGTRLFLVEFCCAVAVYMVKLMCNDGLILFSSHKNGPFYLVNLNIFRKTQLTYNFQMLILLSKTHINEKITYRPFIIHFKVSKTGANSFSLMTPLSTFVHYSFL